jgi:hypothetical protein
MNVNVVTVKEIAEGRLTVKVWGREVALVFGACVSMLAYIHILQRRGVTGTEDSGARVATYLQVR